MSILLSLGVDLLLDYILYLGSRGCLNDRLFNGYCDRLRHFFFWLFYNLLNYLGLNGYFLLINHRSWSFFYLNVRFNNNLCSLISFGFYLFD